MTDHRVAVTGHIFYGQYVALAVQAISSFPLNADFYFTTNSRDIALELEAAGKAARRPVVVAVSENRGRNLGPLVVEFSSVLRKYPLMVHVHSKKSPHGASDFGSVWSDLLWSNLILDQRKVERIYSIMCSDESLGVAYPLAERIFPTWMSTWLKCEGIAQDWARPRGIALPKGQVAFPVGGMFWARPKALEPLLDGSLSYADFGEEAGQLDGTLAHAVERLVGVMPTLNGYRHLVYLPDSDRFTDDTSFVWSSFAAQSEELIDARLQWSGSVSFSLFDTLLRRRHMHREAVMVVGARDVLQASFHDSGALKEYLRARWSVETGGSMEERSRQLLTLSEIASEVAIRTGFSAELIAKSEVHAEIMEALPREPVVRLARRAMKRRQRVMVVSDSPYPASVVRALVERVGLPPSTEIIASADWGVTKWDGDLWMQLVSRGVINPFDHIHVGDARVSDQQMPTHAHVRSIGILDAYSLWEMSGASSVEVPDPVSLAFDPRLEERARQLSDFGESPFLRKASDGEVTSDRRNDDYPAGV